MSGVYKNIPPSTVRNLGTKLVCNCEDEKDVFRAYYDVKSKVSKSDLSTFPEAIDLFYLVKKWRESGSDKWLDEAIIYCERKGFPILPELQRVLYKAARRRIDKSSRKAIKDGIKFEATRIMANLITGGMTLHHAAGRAAAWSHDSAPYSFKASSLERYYKEIWRAGSPSLEDALRCSYSLEANDASLKAWEKLNGTLRDPTQDEKGERR